MVDKTTSIGDMYGQKGLTQKRVQQNTKYGSVTSSLNTGAKANDKNVKTTQQVAKLRNEKFFRVTGQYLASLLNGGSVEQANTVEETKESIFNMMENQPVIATHGGQDRGQESTFVIVDLRDKQEYCNGHIQDALCFPLMLLNQDKTIPELFRFKNKEDKKIIMYVNDERNGVPAATAMVDRGYENTYLLTGGIEKFAENYPTMIAQ